MSEREDFNQMILMALWRADGHTDAEWHDMTVGDDRAIYRKRAEYVTAITGPVDPMYSTEDAAKIFSVTANTMRDWCVDGKIRGIKVGNFWRVPRSEILRISNERHGD